jgi:hypothetical protein
LNSVEQEKKQRRLKNDRDALEVLVRVKEWERPKNHRGDRESWLETLESRLKDAKKFEREVASGLQDLADISREFDEKNSANSEPV